MIKDRKGMLIVVSGPSGVGKGTVCSHLRTLYPELNYSISITTRLPRMGDQEGVTYFFRSVSQFKEMIQYNELIEWTEYVGNYYGTPKKFVEDTLKEGKDVLLEIEVKGARQIKKNFPEGIFIFLVPPKMGDLERRIKNRGTESEDIMSGRLLTANDEMNQIHHYDYVVVNDQVSRACDNIKSIIIAEHCRKDRLILSDHVS